MRRGGTGKEENTENQPRRTRNKSRRGAKQATENGEAKDKAPKAPKPQRIGNRWAGPAMVTSGIIGLIWIVVFYTLSNGTTNIPLYSDLGQWNLVIGMGFIVAAFGFAMKWE